MIEKFALNLLLAALRSEEVRTLILEIVDRLTDQLLPKLAAVIPAAVGAGIKGLGDLTNIDLPDVTVVVEKIRTGVNQQLPDDIDLPRISDLFESTTGFDLTDWIKDRRR